MSDKHFSYLNQPGQLLAVFQYFHDKAMDKYRKAVPSGDIKESAKFFATDEGLRIHETTTVQYVCKILVDGRAHDELSGSYSEPLASVEKWFDEQVDAGNRYRFTENGVEFSAGN